MIRERNIGGVLLFGYNMESGAQTKTLTGALQRLSIEDGARHTPLHRRGPGGGQVSSAPWVHPQPAAARVGARGDAGQAREIAEQMGGELLPAGSTRTSLP